jgi:hypothetical protein
MVMGLFFKNLVDIDDLSIRKEENKKTEGRIFLNLLRGILTIFGGIFQIESIVELFRLFIGQFNLLVNRYHLDMIGERLLF